MSLGESIRTFGSDRMCASTSFSSSSAGSSFAPCLVTWPSTSVLSLRCSSDISLLLASAMDVALDLVLLALLVVRAVLGRVAVALDLVAWLVVRAVLGRECAVALDLGLLVLALLLRHCSSFRSSCASYWRCQPSRREWVYESSHRPFKFATAPAILRRMGRYAAELQAFGRVFANPRVRNVQLAGAGATLGVWAY